jgi:two-component system sensor histidine kinase PilS (NtrC family)
MRKHTNLERIDWFLPLRLTTYVILLAAIVLWAHNPPFLQIPFIIYSSLTLGIAFLLSGKNRIKFAFVIPWIVALHFVCEVIIETVVVSSTGDLGSPFTAMYILTIVSAALVYRLNGTILMASIVSITLMLAVWIEKFNENMEEFSLDEFVRVLNGKEQTVYSMFFHVLILYLVAFISGYLAERLKQRDRQLADTSQALKKAKLETDDILRHLSSGLMTVDANGMVMFFNKAAERILGYSEDDVKGFRCDEVFSNRMPELSKCILAGIVNRMEFPRRELEITNNQGQRVPLGLSTSVLTEENGTIRGVIAIFSDLTDAKELEGKVRAADRLAAVGELSACIAHEIRNPLAAISGSVEVLKKELALAGENKQLMELIVKESDRLTKMLTKFLQYARIERSSFNKVELCHVISETIEILYHQESMSPNIEIEFISEDSIVYVIGDEDLIKQILINLAANACEAIGESTGKITFKVLNDPDNGIVKLLISDNGPGIAPDILRKIYQPFFSTRKTGTGLGLSIVHRIAETLGLDLRVNSKLAEGTTFELCFKTYLQPGVSEIHKQSISTSPTA